MKVLIVEVVRASIDVFSDGQMLTIDCPKAMMVLPSAAVGVGDDHPTVRSGRSYDDLFVVCIHYAGMTYAMSTQIVLYANLEPYCKLLELSPAAM